MLTPIPSSTSAAAPQIPAKVQPVFDTLSEFSVPYEVAIILLTER